jgi:hypothetical protein
VSEGSRPKRHHLVPRFYLRRFAINDQIQMVTRDLPRKSFVTSIDNALVQKEFYSIDTDEGRQPVIEHFFAEKIEPGAARALRRMVDEGHFPPPAGVREAFSLFLAFQFVRGAATRAALLNLYEAVAKKMGSLMTPEMAREQLRDSEGTDPSDEDVHGLVEFARDTDAYRVTMSHENNLHLDMAFRVACDFVPYFANRRWQLSPPTTEGPGIAEITGTQEPTRWRRDGSRPCAQAA